MKKYSVLFFVALSFLACTASFSQRTIKGLIDAEKAFASFTETHTIRDGFLKYLDNEGVVFRQGNAVNAIESFQKQKAGPAILSWEPSFAVISASGDLGITTGPYLLRASAQDTVSGRGNFSSVWKINKEGEWKNLVDLGISYNKKSPEIKQVQETVLTVVVNPPLPFSEIMALDQKFNDHIRDKNANAMATQLAADSWLNAEGETPIIGVSLINNILLHIPDTVLFHADAGNISSAGDLAYVYGSVKNGNKKENYLRVWANRNKRWQIILQTIKW